MGGAPQQAQGGAGREGGAEGPDHHQARLSKSKFGGSWWADRWIKMLESFGHSKRLPRGRYYARTGRVFDFRVAPCEVTAKVQGSRPQPYSVRIEVAALDDRAWERVIEAMASRAVFAAKLLSGEMPQNIGEVFAAASVSLFPKMARDLRVGCSCPDSANLCKHAVAVHYILADAFDADPFILMYLRGRSREEVIDALTRTRARLVTGDSADSVGSGSGTGDEDEDETEGRPSPEPALFFDLQCSLEDLRFEMRRPPVPHAVLSTLGPPPAHNAAQAESALAACYSLVTQQAVDLAYGRESEFRPEPVPVEPAPVSRAPSILSTQPSLRPVREE